MNSEGLCSHFCIPFVYIEALECDLKLQELRQPLAQGNMCILGTIDLVQMRLSLQLGPSGVLLFFSTRYCVIPSPFNTSTQRGKPEGSLLGLPYEATQTFLIIHWKEILCNCVWELQHIGSASANVRMMGITRI